MTALAIVTMLWHDPRYRRGQPYDARHVNRLAWSVSRNLTTPHHHVCLTEEDTSEINSGVTCLPFPTRDYDRMGGCWRKLQLFGEEIGQIVDAERLLYLDLDTVICGSLDPLVCEDVPIALVRCRDKRTPYNTSAILMTAGRFPHIWDSFVADPVAATRDSALAGMIGDDQAWVSLRLDPHQRAWSAEDGVLNFEQHADGRELPENARMVYFAGPHDPAQSEVQARNPWVERHWR